MTPAQETPADDGLCARTVRMDVDGVPIEAYLATPTAESRRGGVVVIHHLPGYDRATKEITRRLAEMGFDAICVNLYSREAPGLPPAEAAAVAREAGWVPDARLVQDVAAAAGYLREGERSNGRVGVIGFCSGGRQAFLSACDAPVDAAVACYGGFVLSNPPADHPMKLTISDLRDRVGDVACPLLGLFGNDDVAPSPEEVDELEELLRGHGIQPEFHRFDGAAHAFFASDRPSYRPKAATEGWRLIEDFFDRTLGREPAGA